MVIPLNVSVQKDTKESSVKVSYFVEQIELENINESIIMVRKENFILTQEYTPKYTPNFLLSITIFIQ